MLASLSLIFLVGLAMGAICPETEAATDHRNTRHRNCVGTVCARFA